jgi:pimeloyl-ACP methyl ester carboxylesterase
MLPTLSAQQTELIVADGLCPAISALLQAGLHPLEILGAESEPLQAIGSLLKRYPCLQTLHLVAHGAPGGFRIGGQWIDRGALSANASALGHWDVAHIALWCCDTGADRAFVALLAELTGAEVLASARPLVGGEPEVRWRLVDGAAEVEAPFPNSQLESWPHRLSWVVTPKRIASPERTSQEFGNLFAFAALKANGSVVTWGESSQAGDSSTVAGQLSSGVVGFANPFTDDRLVFNPNPTITGITDNVGLIQGQVANRAATDDRTPTLSGELPAVLAAGETLRIFNGTALLGSATVNNTARTWSFTPTLPVPAATGTTYAITARVSRANGTLGPASGSRTFTLDLTAPSTTAAITNVADNFGIVKGPISNGGRTDDRTPTITGTLAAVLGAGETLRIFNGTTLLGSATVNNTARTWSFTPTLPVPATSSAGYVIRARVADAAGNLAPASAARSFTLSAIADQSIKDIAYRGKDWQGQPFRMLSNIEVSGLTGQTSYSFVNRIAISDSVTFFASGTGLLNNGLPTYVYAHGWQDTGDPNHPSKTNTGLLYRKLTESLKAPNGSPTANVVLVNWSNLASYYEAAGFHISPNFEATLTKQVGETVADALIKAGADLSKTTLVGHSLGSFVMGAAANEIVRRTGTKVAELVALDTAYGRPIPGLANSDYDIDARNGINFLGSDKPYNFTTAIASTTTSYTVSDLTGSGALAGDNIRAATAQNAYLVQYVRSTYSPSQALSAPTAFHNGVIGVYADLFAKNALHPSSVLLDNNSVLNSQNRFGRNGKPSAIGRFDGVIAAAQPWTWVNSGLIQDVITKAPKAIGWTTDSYNDPIIYGSNAADIMFFDKFKDEQNGSRLFGRDGNDWLVADQTDGKGIDRLTGGAGADQFWFGYQRYGVERRPYLDTNDKTGYGGTAFAVVTDFNGNEDHLNFIWSNAEITRKTGAEIDPAFNGTWGNGVGFLNNGDLIAYVPDLTLSDAENLITSNRISFGQTAQLDSALLA